MMARGTYYGPIEKLRGKTALVRTQKDDKENYLAQFDDLSLGNEWTHGWKAFPHFTFKLAEEKDPQPVECDPLVNDIDEPDMDT